MTKRIKYSIETLYGLRTHKTIEIDSQMLDAINLLRVKEKHMKRDKNLEGKSFKESNSGNEVSIPFFPFGYQPRYDFELYSQFVPQPIFPLPLFKPHFHQYRYYGNGNCFHPYQLPANCRIIKLEPGMEVPPGAIRIPTSLVSNQLSHDSPKTECGLHDVSFENGKENLELASNEKLFEEAGPLSTNSQRSNTKDSAEHPASDGKEETSPYSTLGSSYDSFNIQIQLPK